MQHKEYKQWYCNSVVSWQIVAIPVVSRAQCLNLSVHYVMYTWNWWNMYVNYTQIKKKKNSLLDAFTWITLIVQRNWANTPLWKWDPSNKTNLTLPVPDSALWSLGIKFVICYLTPETVFESFLLELALLLYNSFYCYCHHHGSTCLSLIFVVPMYPAQVFDIKEMLSQKVVKQTIALQRNYS